MPHKNYKDVNIIENWLETNPELFEDEKYDLRTIVSGYTNNLKAIKSVIQRFNINITDYYPNIEEEKIDLTGCILFLRIENTGYELFNNRIMEWGYVSEYSDDGYSDDGYSDDGYLEQAGYHRHNVEIFCLFNKFNKDVNSRPLFSGLAKLDYQGGDHGHASYYIGAIHNNIRSGFGLCSYYLPIDQYATIIYIDNYYPMDTIEISSVTLYYIGYWKMNLKHGIGIISSNLVDQSYKDYILVGRWESNELVEIYKRNENSWSLIKELINFNNIVTSEDYDDYIAYPRQEAMNDSLDDISNLFYDDIYFKLPIIGPL